MERNHTIDTLRTIATLLVILLHISARYVIEGMEQETYDLSFWIGNTADSFSRVGVPLFVLISGMFLVKRNESAKQFYTKRISRIFIPFVVWSFVYIIYRLLGHYVFKDTIDLEHLITDVLLGKPFYHLWYLYMLIGLYLFTPILNHLTQKVSRKSLWYISISLMVLGMVNSGYQLTSNINTPFMIWFMDYLGYFILGFLIKDTPKKISTSILLSLYLISGISISVLSYYTARYYEHLYFYDYLSPLVMMASLSLYKLFHQIDLKENFLSKTSHLTFGIYLIHAGILNVFINGLKVLDIHIFDHPAIGIPVKLGVTFFLSLLMTRLFKNIKYLNKIV